MIKLKNVHHEKPGSSLPKWVREQAAERGYGDADEPLSLFVSEQDVMEAFVCQAEGDGSACVMAQAATRIGAEHVYFYRTTVWVDFGKGPLARFHTSQAIYNNVIVPFDKGRSEDVEPGIYHLKPPCQSHTLASRREDNARRQAKKTGGKSTGERGVVAHTDRVVAASFAT